jgi:hypothetical protein
MLTARGLVRDTALIAGTLLVVVFGSGAAFAVDPAPSPDEAYLDHLQGAWAMAGTLLGKPVRYSATGHRVLQGAFLRLRMVDLDRPPQYEADVYIGVDAKAGDYIAHWLDRFGAAGARVVAQGERRGQQLVLRFPYAEGAFRDTFTWHPESGSWSLLLESQGTDGEWSTFANYTLTRTAQH